MQAEVSRGATTVRGQGELRGRAGVTGRGSVLGAAEALLPGEMLSGPRWLRLPSDRAGLQVNLHIGSFGPD